MITVNKQKMLIPKGEEFLGYAGDHLHRSREFLLEGVSDENLTFRIYLRFDNMTHNFFTVDGENTADGTVLRWDISEEHIVKSGYLLLQIKAFAEDGSEIFHTPTGCFFVGHSLEFDGQFGSEKFNAEFLGIEKKFNDIKNVSAKMPIIGDNGNWMIFDFERGEYVDSAMSSKGEKGDRGEQGPAGRDLSLIGIKNAVWLSDLDWGQISSPAGASVGKDSYPLLGTAFTLLDNNGEAFTCEKGVGIYAPADRSGVSIYYYFSEEKQYDAFETYIGIDGASGANAGCRFRLYYTTWTDPIPQPLYPSIADTTFTVDTPAKYLHVDLPEDIYGLVLEVDPDHDVWASFANARLIKYASPLECDLAREITAPMRTKADANHTHSGSDIKLDVATEAEINELLDEVFSKEE